MRHLKAQYPLAKLRVGVLGMAFKGNSDDPRESLSYKLRKILEYESAGVLCTDPHVKDPTLLPLPYYALNGIVDELRLSNVARQYFESAGPR